VRRFNVFLDDDFPSMAAQPSAEEALNFADFLEIVQFDISSGSDSALRSSVGSLSVASESHSYAARGSDATRGSANASAASGGAGC
jgi:hypothetical protein